MCFYTGLILKHGYFDLFLYTTITVSHFIFSGLSGIYISCHLHVLEVDRITVSIFGTIKVVLRIPSISCVQGRIMCFYTGLILKHGHFDLFLCIITSISYFIFTRLSRIYSACHLDTIKGYRITQLICCTVKVILSRPCFSSI